MSTVRLDPHDRFHRYLFEYRHNGSEYGIVIHARNLEEAKERIKALNFAKYQGEVQATVRVPGFLTRALRRWF